MKIKSQKQDNNTVQLEIEEDYQKYQVSYEKVLAKAGREIKIPGFRAGKAPKDMVERSINPEYLEAQAAQKLISDLYPAIITEAKIDPVDFPSVDIVQQKKDQPFIFKLTIDVYPQVKLGKYKGLKAEKIPTEVTEEEVEKALGNLQDRFSQVGADGQKTLLPLNDEFAKKISQFGTLAELRAEVKKSMEQEKIVESDNNVRNNLVAAASQEASVDIPKGMIDREVNVMLDELRSSLSRAGLALEDYLKGVKKEENGLREEMKKSAEIRVKGKVVLKAVAEAEKMEISPDELEQELTSIAVSSREPLEELKKRLDEHAKEYIKEYMLRKKALDFVLEKAKITVAEKAKEEKNEN